MTTAASILESAGKLVSGDRQNTHGDKLQNHKAIARIWSAYLENIVEAGRDPRRLTGEDVANMMEGMKIARRINGDFNLDDYLDGAGYAAVAGECAAAERGIA